VREPPGSYDLASLPPRRAAGLVNADDSFAPPLRAELDDLGATGLGRLTAEQAADVPAFIASR